MVANSGAKPRPTDFTGRERARLAEDAAKTKAEANKEAAAAAAAEAERKASEVVEVTGPNTYTPVVLDDVEAVDVVRTEEEFEVVTVLDDIQQMTYGVGNNYDFERGRKYKIPRHLADHLREKGYVYGG